MKIENDQNFVAFLFRCVSGLFYIFRILFGCLLGLFFGGIFAVLFCATFYFVPLGILWVLENLPHLVPFIIRSVFAFIRFTLDLIEPIFPYLFWPFVIIWWYGTIRGSAEEDARDPEAALIRREENRRESDAREAEHMAEIRRLREHLQADFEASQENSNNYRGP